MHVKATYGGRAPRPPAHLVGRLRMIVVDGVIAPGEPILIAQVADMLRIDTDLALTVLMELGRDGFLERVGEDAVRVRAVAELPGDEIVQIRRMLEPPATRLAAEHARTVDLITLGHLAERVDAAVQARDYIAFRRADDAFAATLLSLHPNAELARLCTELRLRTAYDGLRVPVEYGVLSDMLRPHARIVAMIASGDFAGVEELSLAIVDRLHFVGAPRMDSPHLVGAPIPLEPDVDDEFLEVTTA